MSDDPTFDSLPEINKESKKTKRGDRGGVRTGSGRPRGAKSAKTLEIEAAAKEYADDALQALVHVALKGKSEGSRVAAATALLDRGYGKPRQALQLSGNVAVAAGVMIVPAPKSADEWQAEVMQRQAALVSMVPKSEDDDG